MAVAKRKDGRWQVVYRDYNQKVVSKYYPKGVQGKKDAYAYDAQIKSLKAARKDLPNYREEDQIYLDDLSQQWVDTKKAQGRKLRWITEWVHVLNSKVLPSLTKKPVSKLTQGDILAVIGANWANHTQATRNRYLRYLKSIFQFGVDQELIEKNPLHKWTQGKEERRKSPLTYVMLKDIKANAPPHLAWALEVMWNIPIRPGPSGLYSLRYDKDYKPERQGFEVYHVKVNKWGFIKISDDFTKKLKEKQLASKSGFLIEYKDRPVKSLRKALSSTAKKLSYPNLCMYDIRHCWITHAIDKGLELSTIAYMAGTSVEMLVRNYYEPHAAEQLRVINILGNLEGGTEKTKGKIASIQF